MFANVIGRLSRRILLQGPEAGRWLQTREEALDALSGPVVDGKTATALLLASRMNRS